MLSTEDSKTTNIEYCLLMIANYDLGMLSTKESKLQLLDIVYLDDSKLQSGNVVY